MAEDVGCGYLEVSGDGDGSSERRDREASAHYVRLNKAVTPPLGALSSRLLYISPSLSPNPHFLALRGLLYPDMTMAQYNQDQLRELIQGPSDVEWTYVLQWVCMNASCH